ncbi:MAG: glycosyltransferase family 9 protein [Bacteroidia bacterium]|nr:glycosyltransferase family 9 protein [Bacteroidia bacterium]
MKILLLRLSSIGDIVLTTPILRSLHKAHPDWEVHYLTKPAFRQVLAHNPYVDKLHLLDKNWQAQLRLLQAEQFDFVLDLHHNLRTWQIRRALGVPSRAFDKRNFDKYLLVHLKQSLRPIPHVVHRYGDTLKPLGVQLDEGGLDFFLPPELSGVATAILADAGLSAPMAVVLGAQHRTKRWITAHFVKALNDLGREVVLIGGPDARADADELMAGLRIPCLDAVARYDLLTSAALMRACTSVLTHDTGFMHIAAAFGMQVFSLWGSTVPALGMTPYHTPHVLLENTRLTCRPCSKIGHDDCPLGHFRCMQDLHPDQVVEAIRTHAVPPVSGV